MREAAWIAPRQWSMVLPREIIRLAGDPQTHTVPALPTLVTIYSHCREGKAITAAAEGGWGLTYLQIFPIDAAFGAICVVPLAMVGGKKREKQPSLII